MAQTLAGSRAKSTRHHTLSNLLLPKRLFSTPPPPSPSPPLLNHKSLTPLSQTIRSISFLLKLKLKPKPTPFRAFHSTPTLRSNFRPLSPHLPVYQPQASSTLSILNRISAIILTATVLGFYILHIKAAQICYSFNTFYQFMSLSSKLNTVVLEISAVAMAYHTFAGIGHLKDDLGGFFHNNKKAALGALLLFLPLCFLLANFPQLDFGSGFTALPTTTKMSPDFPAYWQIVMDKPGGENATKQQMIDCYVQTLAKAVGSEEEAKKRIYNVSCEKNFGFGCEIDEKTSNKLEGLPGVLIVRPDSCVDPEQKDYAAELFANGKIVQRPSEKKKTV